MCGLCSFLGRLHFHPVLESIHSWKNGLSTRYLKQSNIFFYYDWPMLSRKGFYMLQFWLELARTASHSSDAVGLTLSM